MVFLKNDFKSVELLAKPFCTFYCIVYIKNGQENKQMRCGKYMYKVTKYVPKKWQKLKVI